MDLGDTCGDPSVGKGKIVYQETASEVSEDSREPYLGVYLWKRGKKASGRHNGKTTESFILAQGKSYFLYGQPV